MKRQCAETCLKEPPWNRLPMILILVPRPDSRRPKIAHHPCAFSWSRIPVGEGRRVESFAHLLSPAAADSPSVTGAPSVAAGTPAENDRRAAIEARLTSLESEIKSG